MDPVFTLQWPEFLLANRLQKLLPKSQGFSVLIPASRQEKGFDLAIIRRRNGNSRGENGDILTYWEMRVPGAKITQIAADLDSAREQFRLIANDLSPANREQGM